MAQHITILGAGPTGLGTAYRLAEIGHTEWEISERADHVGGLSASVRDEHGFIWDHGGHVMFTKYTYFDELVAKLLGDDYDEFAREAWVWLRDRFISFPFQNNIHRLPPEDFLDCVMGIIEAQREALPRDNFAQYIAAVFGEGIGRLFMYPYNAKVWAHSLESMGVTWQGDRVPDVDVRRILENLLADRDDASWGPNSTFRFAHLGTGELYERLAATLPKPVRLSRSMVEVDVAAKVVSFSDGTTEAYDHLVSTLPLTELIPCIPDAPPEVVAALDGLHHTSGLFVGIGVAGQCSDSKCWVYFPEADTPFYRVTYLSNYSPYVTPDGDYFSLLAEVSASEHKPEDPSTVVQRTIEGMVSSRLLSPEQARNDIVSRHLLRVPYSYPVPSLTRDLALAVIQPWLMSHAIYSRGRFGAWRYEIGNADHSVMMGVELADHLVNESPERTWSLRPSVTSGDAKDRPGR